MKAIETTYAGCRFRSRLEARWAVFFDALGVEWQYEPQGYELSTGRRYLPDFLLTDCGTWVEVKGNDRQLDRQLIVTAALELPYVGGLGESGPRLLLLGPIPAPNTTDWGWVGVTPDYPIAHGEASPVTDWCGFGMYAKNLRPWSHGAHAEPPITVVPRLDVDGEPGCPAAYQAARSARFEHGHSGRTL